MLLTAPQHTRLSFTELERSPQIETYVVVPARCLSQTRARQEARSYRARRPHGFHTESCLGTSAVPALGTASEAEGSETVEVPDVPAPRRPEYSHARLGQKATRYVCAAHCDRSTNP